jgi:NAD(P)-dependent dehydrogenase (short-subunit alcohol dehydrogenase family)
MGELEGKVAIVTGGGRGIGRSIALTYARAGASVLVAARTVGPLEQTCADIERAGGRAAFIRTDIATESDCEKMVSRAIEAFGRLDILVNNVGIAGPTAKITDISLAEWQESLDINLTGCWLASRAALRQMAAQRSGNVVNISSLAGRQGYPLRTPYAATKWAMIGLTQSLALEWGREGIRVNAICPGPVAGERIALVIKARAAASGMTEEQVERSIVGRSALARMVTEDECARLALFLASDASAGITGQSINIDAGIAMN